MKPESVFWQETKKKLDTFSLTRLESWASAGVPDILGYGDKRGFFTIELKVTSSNKIKMKCLGGDLEVKFLKSNKKFSEISITGPAEFVFEGIIDI